MIVSLLAVLATAAALAPSAGATNIYNYQTQAWGNGQLYRLADLAGGMPNVLSYWWACDDQGSTDGWYFCQLYGTHPWGATSYGAEVQIEAVDGAEAWYTDPNGPCWSGGPGYSTCIGQGYVGNEFYDPVGVSYAGYSGSVYSMATDWGPLGSVIWATDPP